MTSEAYIQAVESFAQEASKDCFHSWREELQNIDVPMYCVRKPDRCECFRTSNVACGKCIQCKRCTIQYIPEEPDNSMHSSAGDYEAYPEVYLASVLTKPWFDPVIVRHIPYMHDLISKNRKAMKMTESEILEGLYAIQRKYPNIVAWTHFNTLYIAIIARMPLVIALLTDWMERRGQYFTPAGVYASFSCEYKTEYEKEWMLRMDLPMIARDGPYNLPRYLQAQDWSACTINANHAIRDWVEKNPVSHDILETLGRACASNAHQWQTMCCSAMNGYDVLKDFLGHVAHGIDSSGKRIDIYYTLYGGETPCITYPTKITWHTTRTRCSMCFLDTHADHHKYCRKCISSTITEPLAVKPYECIIAHAVAVRRRKFRGVLRCASILLGKARMIHYKPGVGAYYMEGLQRWTEANI